jgi:DNA-binding transcriptional ArsR family regulator
MKKIVHIIPVGHTKRTLIEGMRQFPFHKIILVLGRENTAGEEKAKKVAREIQKEFKEIAEIEYLYVDVDDVHSTALDMARLIKSEQKKGHHVKVNASGSLRTVGISSYLGCAVTGADLYVALPSYKDGEIKGVRRILEIPQFPLKAIGKEEISILSSLLKNGPTNSADELIMRLNEKTKNSPDYQKERARMSYHIKKLQGEGFIDTQRKGKNLKITLSKIGEIYAVGKC